MNRDPVITSKESPALMKSATLSHRVWLVFLLVISGLLPVQAAIVSRSGSLVVSSTTPNLGTSFLPGDIFTYTLSFDDAITDMDSDPGYAEFSGALVSFTIAPQTLRAGIWTPAGVFGGGSVYAENGAAQSWYFDATPTFGFATTANGYTAVMMAMGFGGLPANGDLGGGQTLGAITGSVLDFVSAGGNNVVELAFEQGLDSQLVTFDLTTFHAPEPGRTALLFGGLAAGLFRRRRR